MACRDVKREGAPVSRPRAYLRTSFQSGPHLSLFLLLKLSVHLILLQFHLSPLKPSNQHPLCSLQISLTHIPLCIFSPSFSISKPHTLILATRHLLAPHHPDRSFPPPTSVAFKGCVFHALVAGQAQGDFPRWGPKVGQEPVVWSDVRAA